MSGRLLDIIGTRLVAELERPIKGYEPVRRPIVALRRRDAVVPEDLVEGLLSSVSRDELER